MAKRVWKEEDHPRAPAGTELGGQFVSKDVHFFNYQNKENEYIQQKVIPAFDVNAIMNAVQNKVNPDYIIRDVFGDPVASVKITGKFGVVDVDSVEEFRPNATHHVLQEVIKMAEDRNIPLVVNTTQPIGKLALEVFPKSAAVQLGNNRVGFSTVDIRGVKMKLANMDKRLHNPKRPDESMVKFDVHFAEKQVMLNTDPEWHQAKHVGVIPGQEGGYLIQWGDKKVDIKHFWGKEGGGAIAIERAVAAGRINGLPVYVEDVPNEYKGFFKKFGFKFYGNSGYIPAAEINEKHEKIQEYLRNRQIEQEFNRVADQFNQEWGAKQAAGLPFSAVNTNDRTTFKEEVRIQKELHEQGKKDDLKRRKDEDRKVQERVAKARTSELPDLWKKIHDAQENRAADDAAKPRTADLQQEWEKNARDKIHAIDAAARQSAGLPPNLGLNKVINQPPAGNKRALLDFLKSKNPNGLSDRTFLAQGKETYKGVEKGAFESYDVEFPNGDRAKVKPDLRNDQFEISHPSRREVMAYDIDTELDLGIVPETVFDTEVTFNGKKVGASYQHYVKDARVGENAGRGDLKYPEELGKIKLLDLIMKNSDRHYRNWLIKDGHLVAIDHGLSMKPESKFSFDSCRRYITNNVEEISLAYDRGVIADYHKPPIGKEYLQKVKDWRANGCKGISKKYLSAEEYSNVLDRADYIIDHWDDLFKEL